MIRRAGTTVPYAIIALMAQVAPLCATSVSGSEFSDQYTVAAGHYAKHRWQSALDEFDALLKIPGDHALKHSVPFFQAEALHQLRRYREAFIRYGQYLEQREHARYQVLAEYRRGECLALIGDSEQALICLERFVARHPSDSKVGHAQLYSGQCQLALGRAEEAQESYLAALEWLTKSESFPELTSKCRFGLAKSLQASGDTAQAIRFFRFVAVSESAMADDALLQVIQFESETDPAIALRSVEEFRERFATSSQRPAVELVAARLLRARGLDLQAGDQLADLVDETTTEDVGAELLFEAGRAYHAAGKTKLAERCFQQLSQRWPNAALADDGLYCRILIADPKQIVPLGREFMATYPDNQKSPYLPDVVELLGEALIQRQQFVEAAECLATLHDGGARVGYLEMLALLGAEKHEQAVAIGRSIAMDQLEERLRPGAMLAWGAALARVDANAEASQVLSECLQLLGDEASPRHSQCVSQRAIVLAEQDRIEEAMEMAVLLPPKAPNRLATLRFVAAKARAIEAYTEAALMLARVVESEQATLSDWDSLVRVAWKTNRLSESESHLKQFCERYPHERATHQAAIRCGRISERRGLFESAEENYRWLSQREGGAGRAGRFLLGRLAEQRGDDRQAIALLKPLVEDPSEPRHDTDPSNLDAPSEAALYHLAWAYLDNSQPEEAQAAFAQLAESSSQDSPLRMDAVFRAAKLEVSAGKPTSAGQRIDKLLAELEDHSAAHRETSAFEDEASRQLVRNLRMLRAHVGASAGEWGDVIDAVSSLASSNDAPGEVRGDASFLLAEAHYRKRDLAAAEAGFRSAMEFSAAAAQANSPPSWAVLAELRMAQILAARKQWIAAGNAAQTLLEAQPMFARRAEAAYLLGRCCAARARFADARAAYERVLEMPEAKGTVTAAKSQWMIGETHFHQKDYKAAIRAYHRVELLYEHPQWQALALLQIGKCQRRLGMNSEANQMFDEVLRKFPRTRAALEAQTELERKVAVR